MHSPEIHTSRDIVNYNKEDPLNVVHLCNKACYNLVKERGTDERFLSYPVPRKRERSLHTCAQDVQITRMATI
jgi:hypothetical protein